MVKVQFRDAANPDKVLVDTFAMPSVPAEGIEVRVRRRTRDNRARHYRIVRPYSYEVFTDEPHESGVALLVTELAP